MELSTIRSFIVLVCLLVLTSCGGGGGGGVVLPPGPGPGPVPNLGGNQGSASAPKDLGVTAVDFPLGSVAYVGTSYYQFKTTTSGSYKISLTNTTVRMEWDLYAQLSDLSAVLPNSLAEQDDIFTSAGDLTAVAPNLDANTTYYLAVTDWDTSGGTFHISIVNGSSEGSKADPTTLTADGSAHSGGVDANGYSYYQFTTAGGSVNISLSGLSDPNDTLTWALYPDNGFSVTSALLSCNTDAYAAGSIECAADNLAAGTYYLEVSNYYNYPGQDIAYTIAVTPDAAAYYGTPALLQLDSQVTATVLKNEMTHYYIDLPTPGTYTFTIDSLQNIAWDLYSDPGYTNLVKHCDYGYTYSNQTTCETGNIAHGVYYLRLTNNYTGAASYALTATAGGSEGAIGDPIPLTSGATYTNGKVLANGTSYYSFQTEALSQSAPYLIALGTPGYGASWALYSDVGFSNEIANCTLKDWNYDIVCSTTDSGGPALLPGTTYYVAVSSSNYPGAYSINVSPLASSAGCTAGGTCYDFEGGTLTPFTGVWSVVTTTSGSGTHSAQSSLAHNQTSSCFSSGSLTDVKYVVFSLSTNFGDPSDVLHFYMDGNAYQFSNNWTGANPWQRVVIRAFSSGTHSYQWCHESSNVINNNAWVDDVEFVY